MLLLLRTSVAGANMSKGMSNIQPKMQEIQEKYKDDPKKLSEETMKLLKKEGIYSYYYNMQFEGLESDFGDSKVPSYEF